MRYEEINVTPEIARLWLEKNTGNRRVSSPAVAKMTADMVAGRWVVNPQSIIIAANGRLLDGQHRLLAVIASGRTIRFTVVFDAPEESFDVIDQGQPRSAGQVLNAHGVPNGDKVAAAARLILRYDLFPGLVWSSTADVSKHETIEFARRNLQGFTVTGSLPRTLTKSSWMALEYLVLRDGSKDMWDDFAHGVATGEMLRVGDPRLTLRNQAVKNTWGNGQSRLLGLIIGWNAWVNDRDLKIIRVRRESLPMPKVQ